MSIEEEFPSSMPEYAVQDAIHGMSHQKVHAEDKWGFLPMTQERVDRLIEVVEENRSKYGEAKLYLEILNRWSNNNFSRADKDHNAIWKLQLGTLEKQVDYYLLKKKEHLLKNILKLKMSNVRLIDVTFCLFSCRYDVLWSLNKVNRKDKYSRKLMM